MEIPPLKVTFPEEDRELILDEISRILTTGYIAQGKNVDLFEREFAAYFGARHAVAVSSGGAAIEIGMHLLDVQGKEVLAPTNTFLATAVGVLRAGGKVRLVDADPESFGVSLAALQKSLSKDTAGVVLVHIGGIVNKEMPAIRSWCEESGIWLFEDAAHAHGSKLGGTFAGRFGIAGAFSLFATKVITCGEGGVLVTDNDEFASRARSFRDYGKKSQWVTLNTELGSNWRMPEISAVIALTQLRRLDQFIAERERVAAIYTARLSKLDDLSLVLPSDRSSWYKYIVLLPPDADRSAIKAALQTAGIKLPGGVYETPLHGQPVFAGKYGGPFPVADEICSRHICLPLYPGMPDDWAVHVAESLERALRPDG